MRSLCVCLCLLCGVRLAPCSSASAAAAQTAEAEIRLPYGGDIPESAARRTARALAWHRLLEQITQQRAASALLRMGAESSLHRQALIGAVHAPLVQSRSTRRECVVRVRSATPPRAADDHLRALLRVPDMPQARIALLALEKTLASEAAALLKKAAALRRRSGNTADAPLTARISLVTDRLEGLWLFGRALAMRAETHWNDPQQALVLLEQAAALETDFRFLRCALGEVLLQLDRPQDALEELNRALAADPPPASALYARGLTYLRLQLPSLAERDLDAALERDPRPAAWWRARGALRMMQHAGDTMCSDFEQACARGDCEGAALARARGLCLPGAQSE